ncbi:hypothetical protein ANCDUO_20332 [Ancylostoma duodenale]|uniref:HECT-type E3 ubiquitin transferase n=1 Tax=Ancylostoma duodenale TaxID=51022 RepID=A0A0C2CIH3_9BILA|nr:hypothetical protein ANCDUO_20332 [Ancylostoma duodenale]
MAEFEKKTSRGLLLMRRMSHLISLKERMLLFRKFVTADKANIESTATLITVARNRLVEDGYRQLSLLSTRALKSTIRVKFVNQQGLDEAGIDQDGVFKEFLELTIKQVFDPALNLFHVQLKGAGGMISHGTNLVGAVVTATWACRNAYLNASRRIKIFASL